MPAVLIITYYWPPSGGAGVQRWLKFASYLPEFGWEPVILTIDPDYATYPVTDSSLEADIPGNIRVFRTKATDFFRIYKKNKSEIPTAGFAGSIDNSLRGKLSRFVRGNFFIPDPRKGWNRFALKKASDLIESLGITNVVTTSPPHSTQLIGLKLKKIYPHLNWIADLRDPWTDIYYYDLFYPTFISRAIDSYYEKSVIRKADKLITVGQNLAMGFESKFKLRNGTIDVITNGYDEKDFSGTVSAYPERFTITYVGTLSEAYPVDAILEALSSINNDFILRFTGTVPPEIKEKIVARLGISRTEFLPYCPHAEAVKRMRESSLLVLIIPRSKESKVITTGKIFEYLATGRQILYVGPVDGDAAIILKNKGYKGVFSGEDSGEIAEFIMREMENPSEVMKQATEFSRRNLTRKFSELLEPI